MATVNAAGLPETRTVVLRKATKGKRLLEIHTDQGSAKHDSLLNNSGVSFCFWDARTRTQLRLSGTATMLALPEAGNEWANLSTHGQRVYKVSPPPGTPIDAADEFSFTSDSRFVCIRCTVDCIDALALRKPKHQRMGGRWVKDRWDLTWLVP